MQWTVGRTQGNNAHVGRVDTTMHKSARETSHCVAFRGIHKRSAARERLAPVWNLDECKRRQIRDQCGTVGGGHAIGEPLRVKETVGQSTEAKVRWA